MKIKKLRSICFSPAGTTKTIVNAIERGLNINFSEQTDITNPNTRKMKTETASDELLLIAVPVYMGRVPSVLTDYFNNFIAYNTPVICVVVYGNRAYDDALLELKDLMTKCGCKIVAAAAFIAEHSFSSSEFPSSVGRPDKNDLQIAENFGKKIKSIIENLSTIDEIKNFIIPGNYPYGGTKNLWHLDFISVNENCNKCLNCVNNCPVAAINYHDVGEIDINKCTLCCACIKLCPQQAKTMKAGPMREAAIRCTKFTDRKEAELFY